MKKLSILFIFFINACASKIPEATTFTCTQNPEAQTKASGELVQMVEQDQKNRTQMLGSQTDIAAMVNADKQRRQRTQELADAKCITSAKDYANAALIFQHGETSKDYYQALQWGLQSLHLNSSTTQKGTFTKSLVAATADRYLVSIGQQQIFGTQYLRPGNKSWCQQPQQKGVPEKLQMEWLGQSAKNYQAQMRKAFGIKQKKIGICATKLKPTQKGTLPPMW